MNLDNIYGKLKYNTMNKIQKVSFYGAMWTSLTSFYELSTQKIETYGMITIPMVIFDFLCINFSDIKVLEKSKDVSKIKELYIDVLKEYNKLIEIFGFNNPIELYGMFFLAYRLGYLSNNKKYEYGECIFEGFPSINGINIICGTGVCRHISTMFTDILTLRDIESCVLPGVSYQKDAKMEKNLKTLRKYVNGNHTINAVRINDVSYFLDCTNSMIYHPINSSQLISDDYIMKIRKGTIKSINSKKIKDIKPIIDMSERSLEDDSIIAASTYKHCQDNMDIFEKFYDENKDKYAEIYDKMKILKK